VQVLLRVTRILTLGELLSFGHIPDDLPHLRTETFLHSVEKVHRDPS